MAFTGLLSFALWNVMSLSQLRSFSGDSEGPSVPWGREPGTWGVLSSRLPSVHCLSDLGHLSDLGQSPHLWDVHLGTPRPPRPSSLSALMPVVSILEGGSRSDPTRPIQGWDQEGGPVERFCLRLPRAPGMRVTLSSLMI